MVGGKVIEVIVLEDKVYIDCIEQVREYRSNETCAIYVERSSRSESVRPGDSVWWQSGQAYWTPQGAKGAHKKDGDFPMQRIGFSGVNKPTGTPIRVYR